MSSFIDALTHGTWYLQAPGGGYLTPSTQNDPSGNPYLTTAPTRAAATKFAFTIVATISPTVVQATLRTVTTNRYLAANSAGDIVLAASPPTDGSSFTVTQRRPTVFALAWKPGGGTGAGNVVLDSGTQRFSVVSSAQPVPLLLAIDPPAGSRLWTRQLGSQALGAPATFGGFQVVAGASPMLTCIETMTGRIAWEAGDTLVATSPTVVSWTVRAALVAAGSTVHAVSIDTAQDRWSFTASSGVYARPRAAAGDVFVCASYGVLSKLAAQSGVEAWRFPASGTVQGLYATPALLGTILYVGAWDGSAYAVDITSGRQVWSFATGDRVNGVMLATDEGVYVGNDSGNVFALNPADGTEIWSASVDGIVQSRPARHGGQLLVATFAGTVFAFDARTGAQLWSVGVGGPVVSDIAVSDGIAYLTTTPGELVALTLVSSGPPAVSRVALGGQSAGSVNVFSGTANALTGAGLAVSTAVALRSDLQPIDLGAALQASDLANQVDGTTAPAVPPSWTVVGALTAPNAGGYGTVLVLTLRRPSDDTLTTVLAFGVAYNAFLDNYDPTTATLVALPASIAGSNSPAGAQVTDSVLADYLAMRAGLLALIGGPAGKTLLVTGQGQGGAFATLAALDFGVLKNDTPSPAALACASFGAPPAGNQAFAGYFGSTVSSSFRVIVPGDTTISSLPGAWVHVPGPLTLGQGFPSPFAVGTVQMYMRAMAGMA